MLGGSAIPMYSITVAYANDRLQPHQIVAASGSLVMIGGIGLMIGPITIAFFMDLLGMSIYFWGIGAVFGLIFLFTLIRISSRQGIAPDEQSSLVAGTIGTPIAEFNAPEPVEYAKAIARDEVELLDQREDVNERQL